MNKKFFITASAILTLLLNFSGKPGGEPPAPKTVSISFSGAFALYPLAQV